MNEVRFPYKPKTGVLLFSSIFFAGCGLTLVYIALTNDRALVLNRIIEFSADSATIFYWCLAAASGLFVVFGVLGLYAGVTTKKEIVLTERTIISPKSGMSNKIVSIEFCEIVDMNMQTIQGQRFLSIRHQDGKLTIPQGMLADKEEFETLVSLLQARIIGQQAAPTVPKDNIRPIAGVEPTLSR